jgi:CBS domain-containing protein
MQVRNGMTDTVLVVGPSHTLREAAMAMSSKKVGAAVVNDLEQPGPGIITERDILESLGAGQDPDQEQVCEHLSANLTFASPDWSLERAAEAMVRGGFRHLVVVEDGETVGVLSIRDIVRCWTQDGATSEMPHEEAPATQ